MELPISFLHECFVVVDGELIWRDRPRDHFKSDKSFVKWNKDHSGKPAGYKLKTKTTTYVKIRMESKFANANLNAHRIAFALYHGRHPQYFVDHIDGDGLNNSKENLRDVTNAISNTNMRRRSSSSSLISGVSFRKSKNKWYSVIYSENIKTHLGVFDNLFDACCARISEQNIRGFSARHGRD